MKRILVVDDDRQMVRTLCDILALHGWETHARHNGEDAVAAVREQAFAAVLMDVKMDGMGGVEALSRIRRERPGARVILMTGYSSTELLEQAEREGALDIVAKPVLLPRLIEGLGRVLDRGDPVLVVDRDPELLQSISGPLRGRGFEVRAASSPDHGLALLSARQPVAAVLDLDLGDAGPGDVVLAIRRASPAVAAILCRAECKSESPATPASPNSLYGAVRKPFAPDHLIGMLDGIVPTR